MKAQVFAEPRGTMPRGLRCGFWGVAGKEGNVAVAVQSARATRRMVPRPPESDECPSRSGEFVVEQHRNDSAQAPRHPARPVLCLECGAGAPDILFCRNTRPLHHQNSVGTCCVPCAAQ